MRRMILLIAALCSALCITAFAAESQRDLAAGFYNIGFHSDVTVEARLADNTAAAVVTAAVGDGIAAYYENAVRLSVTYTGAATSGDYFTAILVTGSGLPTSSNTICYINQVTAGTNGVSFDIYPMIPASTTDLTLYITSKRADFTTIAIPVSYAVANTYKQAPYIPGDANNDMTVNINDALAVINHISDNILLEGNDLLAADANKDSRINVNDVLYIIDYIMEHA